MKINILFGLPGAGKTFVGRLFAEKYGYYFYEGDDDLTEEMKDAIQTKTPFTDPMRDVFFKNLIQNIQKMSLKHEKIVAAQTFIKEKYREMLLQVIPEAKFILVSADDDIREERLLSRTAYPLDLEYARSMKRNFEVPVINHQVIINNDTGTETLVEEIQLLL